MPEEKDYPIINADIEDKETGIVLVKDGKKVDNLHRRNIDSKEKEKQETGIEEYENASTDADRIQALEERVKTLEKIIHGSEIHAGGDA